MTDQTFTVQDFILGLRAGDFSRLAPAFEGARPLAQQWDESGALDAAPDVRAETLTAAYFLGELGVAEYFLGPGIDTAAGAALTALCWAGG